MALGCFIVLQSHHGSRDSTIDRQSWIRHALVKKTARRMIVTPIIAISTAMEHVEGQRPASVVKGWNRAHRLVGWPSYKKREILGILFSPQPSTFHYSDAPTVARLLFASWAKEMAGGDKLMKVSPISSGWQDEAAHSVCRFYIYIYCIFNLLFLGLKSKYLVLFVIMEKTVFFFFFFKPGFFQ